MNNRIVATVAGIYSDGVTLTLPSGVTTTKHYKCNASASINTGDLVVLTEIGGTYVVDYVVGRPNSRTTDGGQGIQGATGPEGPAGKSGVWYGSTAPTSDQYVVWINPDGEADNPKKQYQAGQIHFTVKVCQNTFRDETSANVTADSYTTLDVPAVLRLPTAYTQMGKACPLIILCHGAGYGVSSNAWTVFSNNDGNSVPSFDAMLDAFVNAGFAVADVNGYNTALPNMTWGCPRAVQAYRKLYEYLVENYNVEKHVLVYGFSMGGLVALNFAFNNRDIVKAIALGAPVTGVYKQCWNSQHGAEAGWRRSAAVAFDFQNIAGVNWQIVSATPNQSEAQCWNDNIALTFGYDPHARIKTINGTELLLSPLPPLKAWHGTADTSVEIAPTETFINAARAAGQYAFLRTVTGGTHGISFGTNTHVTEEIIMWFKRWTNDEMLR